MKLAKQIADALDLRLLADDQSEYERWVCQIDTHLAPIREALHGAGKVAQAFGPAGYCCRAFIKEALALMEEE